LHHRTPGANYRFLAENISIIQAAIQDSVIIVAQLEISLETVRRSLKLAKKLGKTTILNPAPACKLDNDLLDCVDILIPNETELEHLSGVSVRNETEIIAAARNMLEKGIKDVIVTMGEKGCIHVSSGQYKIYPAYQVNAADTTAAGDGFTGAMAVALSEGKNITAAIPFAMAVAALTVTKKWAQSSLPYRREVEEFVSGIGGIGC
jgi:ribokinase